MSPKKFLKNIFLFYTLICSQSGCAKMQDMQLEALATAFERAHGVPSIKVSALKKAKDKGQRLLLFDVRAKEEQGVSQIASAVLLAEKDDPLQIEKIKKTIYERKTKDIDQKIWFVFYCAVGARSGKMAAKLLEEENNLPKSIKIYNLHGGIFAWANAGYPLLDPKSQKATNEVHGYNTKWARFLHPPAKAVLK